MNARHMQSKSLEIMIFGTAVGAGIGATLSMLLSKPDNRKKAFRLWDEVKDEAIDFINIVSKRSRTIWKEDRRMLEEGRKS